MMIKIQGVMKINWPSAVWAKTEAEKVESDECQETREGCAGCGFAERVEMLEEKLSKD